MWRCSKCHRWGNPATHECTETAMPLDLEKLRKQIDVLPFSVRAELLDLAERADHYETALREIYEGPSGIFARNKAREALKR